MDIYRFLEILDDIDKWRDVRNEIVHAMFNKNILQLEESVRNVAEEGRRLAYAINEMEKGIKAGNKIRRKANLPMK